VVSGETMARVFSEWRTPASACGGALVWFHRDFRPGAGWGIVDSTGRPKAAYWYLRRAWRPRTLRITDEGLDGLALHAINESDSGLDALVELELLNAGRVVDAAEPHALRIEARGARTLGADALLGRFTDAGNVYRFGPPKYDVIAARLRDAATGEVVAEDFFFPAGLDLALRAADLRARAQWRGDGVALELETDSFLQAVRISSPGFAPDDNYFHLAPGRAKSIGLRATPESRDCRIDIEALNWSGCASVRPKEGA
jgi:beta-mannosidase